MENTLSLPMRAIDTAIDYSGIGQINTLVRYFRTDIRLPSCISGLALLFYASLRQLRKITSSSLCMSGVTFKRKTTSGPGYIDIYIDPARAKLRYQRVVMIIYIQPMS
jgi:hypothetical protein